MDAQFLWKCQPEAEALLLERLGAMTHQSEWLAALEETLKNQTSTRLFDWVDHLVITGPLPLDMLGFEVQWASPGVRFYHHGDTALFSDLKLIGELYEPNVGCIGMANAPDVLARVEGPGHLTTAEMDPREAALAAQWLRLEVVLPCHYSSPDTDEMQAFLGHLDEARRHDDWVPRAVVLRPGETFSYSGSS